MAESYDPYFNIAEELESRLEALNKSKWVRRTGVYHPSALSGCRRALYYDRIGEKPVQNIRPTLRMLFGAGHACHDFIQGVLSDKGKTEFESEIAVSVKEYDIFGHTDGVYRKRGWVIVIKSISDNGFRVLVKPKTEHILQLHCYMKALGMPRGQILYVNRDNGQYRAFRIKFDGAVWSNIVDIINYVEGHVKNNTIPDREESFFYCRSCKFAHTCKPVY